MVSNRSKTPTAVAAIVAAALAWTGAPAATVTKTVDRKFPLTFCPLDLTGWQDAGSNPVDLSFVAPPSGNVRITVSSPNYTNGVHLNTHLDNVSVVLKSHFPDTAANVHAPLPLGNYYACYFPPGGDESQATHTSSFIFTNYTWPGPAGPLLNLFDSDVECWTGDVYHDTLPLAPRDPVTEGDLTGGSLGIGTVVQAGTVSASRIVTGLLPGQTYVVFAWWHAEKEETPFTIAIGDASCIDSDGDSYVDCTGCTACELQGGQTCGDCNDADPTIYATAPDATCDGIDQNCSGQADEGFPGGCQCVERGSDLAGWWPAEGNATDLAGPNDGTQVGAGVSYQPGFVGDAFYFSYINSGGIQLPDDAALEFTSQMTIEAWIGPEELTESSRPIVNKLGDPFGSAYALHAEPGGLLEATLSGDGTSIDFLDSPPGVVSTEAWAHVAMTFDAGLWKLYVNGEVVASKVSTITSIYDQGATPPNLGRAASGSPEFVGYIDEVAMYDRALGDGEVRAIFQAGASGMCQCVDLDDDGYGIDGLSCPGGTQLDCDDADADIRPGQVEICNDLDDDCDGQIDDGLVQITYYRDFDLDGYGRPTSTVLDCAAPAGYVAAGGDCVDADPEIHPGAPETCDGVDENCDGQFDDGFPQSTFYRDVDNDTYGNPAVTASSCAAPVGHVANSTDCDDTKNWIHPGASDASCDGYDQDCNGGPDDGYVSPADGWFATPVAGYPENIHGRLGMTLVGAGDKLIVWGGATTLSTPLTNTGGVYRPVSGFGDWWTATSTGANVPAARERHSAVWTGSEMIVWGGYNGASTYFVTGGRYNPSSDTWTPTSTGANLPVGRIFHTAIWTGSRMLVWGGFSGSGATSMGAIYDPATDAWTAMTQVGAPSPRARHTAVWTGTEMLIWGGYDGTTYFNNGARYNPTTNTWTAMVSPGGLLTARRAHTAAWTGTQMVVWGGYSYISGTHSYKNDGAIYTPATNSWVWGFTGLTAREDHAAVWDPVGARMVIWGGYNGAAILGDGAAYDPVTHVWSALPGAGAPAARAQHAAAWLPVTSEFVVWGGSGSLSHLNTGGRLVAAPFTCGIGACEQPSEYTCSAGQLGYGCFFGAAAVPPAAIPSLSVTQSGPTTNLIWSSILDATHYDVVTGSLSSLRTNGGDFAASTTGCLGNDLTATTTTDPAGAPAAGAALWYLLRPVDGCAGNGTYDDGSVSQQASRDGEIFVSPGRCPW